MKIDKIQPVFILGNPRSGTSLFRLMLNNHKNIVATPECGFSHWLFDKYKDWSEIDITKRGEAFVEDVQKSRKFETWHLKNKIIKENIIRYKPTNYADLVKCVYISYATNPENVKVVTDKNNYYIEYIEDLPKIWPQAKYIHFIRDIRDVACSYLDIQKVETPSIYIPKLTTNLKEVAEEWKSNNKKIESIKSNSTNNYYLVKYEDLVTNTTKTLKDLMIFLGLDYDEEMLNYYKNDSTNKMEPEETIAWKKKTKEKPDSQRIGRYKSTLSDKEIINLNTLCANELNLYNYEL